MFLCISFHPSALTLFLHLALSLSLLSLFSYTLLQGALCPEDHQPPVNDNGEFLAMPLQSEIA
jgi:hypothetical protein